MDSSVSRSECQAIFAKLGEAARLGHEANHDVGLEQRAASKVAIYPTNTQHFPLSQVGPKSTSWLESVEVEMVDMSPGEEVKRAPDSCIA